MKSKSDSPNELRINVARSYPRARPSYTKRILDVAFATAFFLVLGWLFLIIWICVIYTTGRPAIYKHTRVGLNGKKFQCLKFRSMIVDSDKILEQLLKSDPAAREEWNRDFKLKNDPRVTKFGKLIRRTSLDELPQFWNVLVGDMSIVGPRPVTEKELLERYGIAAKPYMTVRPGITGLWQVSGRSDLSYSERIILDTKYVNDQSIWNDIKIIIKTVALVLIQKGSY